MNHRRSRGIVAGVVLTLSLALTAPSLALAGGTDVGVTIVGVGKVVDDQGLQDCSSSSSRVDCTTYYYASGTTVNFTASTTDSRWRFDRWSDDGPNTIGCDGTELSCGFWSGYCVACAYHDHITATFVVRDDDGDGYNALVDCNDSDSKIHPGAVDVPHDGIDQDCSGQDNRDADGDKYDSDPGPDCNDSNASIHPGAVDIAHDGVDQDCDGKDNLDGDGDGYPANPGPDCNDNNAAVHPGASEVAGDGIDEDCDGPPDTQLTSSEPPNGALVRAITARFTFASPPNPGWNAAFDCKLDQGAWGRCGSPASYSGLTDGPHLFQVRGVDADGFADPSPASVRWVVDTTAPATAIVSGPPDGSLTDLTTASFAFVSERGARFQCRVDTRPFGPCSGPGASHTASGLGVGTHRFEVRAVDAAGNVDATPAGRSWRITADFDGDGYVVPGDCDDHNRNIHPGAPDIPGNGIDEDCDHHDAPFPRLQSDVGAQWRFSPFRFTKLLVRRVMARSLIVVRCHGRGCTFRSRSTFVRRSHGRISVLGRLGRAQLRRGATVTVRVTKSGYDGVMRRYTVRGAAKDPRASDYCVPAQGGAPKPC